MKSIVAAGLLALAGAVLAQHQTHAGQEARGIKALSADEVKQYLAGGGMGYAKPAELNRHPGPMHVLELADKLQLTDTQRAQTQGLMDVHKAEARAIGAKLIESERALEALLRENKASQAELARAVQAAAALNGEYRLSHLETHRRMRALLSDEQVQRYDMLRGYAAGGQSGGSHTGGGHKH